MRLFIIFATTKPDQGIIVNATYHNEDDAVADCRPDEGIVEIETDCRLPLQACEAIKLWWPHMGKWEDSPLYKMQQEAKRTAAQFLEKTK